MALPILTYHFVGDYPRQRHHRSIFCHAPVFASQMRWLHRLGWRTLPLSEIARHLETQEPFPARRFALTFDDGDADLVWSAVPVLKDLGFHATAFIVTGSLGARNDWESAATLKGRPLLDSDDLAEMIRSGWEIGSHTVTHANLTRLDGEALSQEIRDSRKHLEEGFGVRVEAFCYPSGAVNPHVARAVQDAGFRLAVTTRRGRLVSPHDPYLLPRVSISHRASPMGLFWRVLTAPAR